MTSWVARTTVGLLRGLFGPRARRTLGRTSATAVCDVNLDHVKSGGVERTDEGTSESRRDCVPRNVASAQIRFGFNAATLAVQNVSKNL